jgi:hypothetical protein
MDITLITSVYRAEAHLPTYAARIQKVLGEIQTANIQLEMLIIANDATPAEKAILDTLPVRVVHVPRETLYASWNRGIQLASAPFFGFWNVDDERHSDGLIASYWLLQQGYTLVDTPFRVINTDANHRAQRDYVHPVCFSPTVFTRKNPMGPFALMRRTCYDQVGAFDEHFRIVGDLDWGGRAQTIAHFAPLDFPGGTMHIHGNNLSSTGRPLQAVEENIVFLRRGQWDELHPADPHLMRESWAAWGKQDRELPPAVADWLWGSAAQTRFQNYQREKQQPYWLQRLRLSLARRGILHSEEWALRARVWG